MASISYSLLALFSFILLSFAASHARPNSVRDRGDPVLDVDGYEVVTGVRYYMVSRIWGAGGGGLGLASIGKNECPLSVVQEQFGNGLPLVFSIPNSDEKYRVVRENELLNIKFDVSTGCEDSPVWKLNETSTGNYVITGRNEGDGFGFRTADGGNVYILVNSFLSKNHNNPLEIVIPVISIVVENGYRRLVSSFGDPWFELVLIRAEDQKYIRQPVM